MARRRFFVDEVRHGLAVLTGDDGRHLRQVLRAEPGQLYELSDNRSVYLAEIEAVGKDEVSFRIVEKLAAEEPPLRLTLFLALIKFERFEWAIEKATELGVEAVVPVRAERSEKGLERAARKRVERWRKIVLALIDALEDNDDVQNVYSNYDIPDEIMEKATAAAA